MAYVKNIWNTGDLITKQKLDHIEDGIYQNNVEIDMTVSTIGDLETEVSSLRDYVTTMDNELGVLTARVIALETK